MLSSSRIAKGINHLSAILLIASIVYPLCCCCFPVEPKQIELNLPGSTWTDLIDEFSITEDEVEKLRREALKRAAFRQQEEDEKHQKQTLKEEARKQRQEDDASNFAFDSSGRILERRNVKVDALPRPHRQGFSFCLDQPPHCEDSEVMRYLKNRRLELRQKGLIYAETADDRTNEDLLSP